MIDRANYTDHRRQAAMMTDQASHRGWDFRDADESPVWFRALAECIRPRSLFIFAAMGAVIALWWL